LLNVRSSATLRAAINAIQIITAVRPALSVFALSWLLAHVLTQCRCVSTLRALPQWCTACDFLVMPVMMVRSALAVNVQILRWLPQWRKALGFDDVLRGADTRQPAASEK
jgi:hypothetical protein